jgi:hypothetical protein
MIFTIIIAIVIFLFAYVLFTPISFEIYNNGSAGEKPKARIRIFPFPFIVLSSDAKSGKKAVLTKEPKIKPKRTNKGNLIGYLLSNWDLLEIIIINFFRLLIGLIKCPDRYFFNIDLYGGLSQPHLTGQLYGALCAITPILPESANIRYYPDFSDESIRADFRINITIHLAAILSEIIKFLCRLPVMRIAKLVWMYRKDGNYAYQN